MELPPDGKDGHHVTQLDSQIFDHLDLALLCRLFSECCATALASPSIPATEREALRLRIGKSLTREPARALVFIVAEKGKPLAEPAK
jgi:hypothetical protein